jgi:5'-nucleotidase
MFLSRSLIPLLLLLYAGLAPALDIVLTNDDGFETANVRALYQRLKAAGHDVVISAPTNNQSGSGGRLEYQRTMAPLTRPSRYGGAETGAPGVGTDNQDGDIHYVDGTPVTALLFGVDVVAARRWGRPPDLVISGPNEGGNTGPPIISSGTVSCALYAINRGLPAIAVSDAPWDKVAWTRLAPDSRAWAVADLVVRLVAALEAGRRPGKPLLPRGAGLNVNVPDLPPAQLADAEFRLTHIGGATDYWPMFFEKLDESALARRLGQGSPLPGLSSAIPGEQLPPGVVIPADDDPRAESNAVRAGFIAVSVMQGVPEAPRSQQKAVRQQLRALIGK